MAALFRSLGLLALCLLFVAAPQGGQAQTACGGRSCKALMLDHLARSKERLRQRNALGACRISNSMIGATAPSPEAVVDTSRHGHSAAALEMSAFLIVNASRWYFNDDGGAGSRAIAGLVSWAEADAHARAVARYRGSSERWPTYGLMTSVLNALFLLDNHPDMTQARRELVYAWAERTLKRAWIFAQLPEGGAGYEDREQRKNNHNARRSLALLYWGILTDDRRDIQKSVADLRRTFAAIDRNGAPYDANRGDWALRYVNFALDSAVIHQSLLSIVDPRALRPSDLAKLDAATVFLFSEARNPERIHGYAKANIGRPDAAYPGRQDLDWLMRTFDGGMLWWAWVDTPIFRSAMPRGAEAARAALSSRPQWRAAKYDDTGGLVTCWFG